MVRLCKPLYTKPGKKAHWKRKSRQIQPGTAPNRRSRAVFLADALGSAGRSTRNRNALSARIACGVIQRIRQRDRQFRLDPTVILRQKVSLFRYASPSVGADQRLQKKMLPCPPFETAHGAPHAGAVPCFALRSVFSLFFRYPCHPSAAFPVCLSSLPAGNLFVAFSAVYGITIPYESLGCIQNRFNSITIFYQTFSRGNGR